MDQKVCQPVGDQVVCVDPLMCFKPAKWVCSEQGPMSCRCELPAPTYSPTPGPLCTATIVYGQNTPGNPQLVPMETHCDSAGAELAIAVILSRLLGGN